MQGREPIVIRREKLLEAAVCCDGIDLRDTQAVADQRRILRAADIGKGKPPDLLQGIEIMQKQALRPAYANHIQFLFQNAAVSIIKVLSESFADALPQQNIKLLFRLLRVPLPNGRQCLQILKTYHLPSRQ